MAQYSNLPALRGALTADGPDKRAEAYSAVLNVDVQPSEVLDSDPSEATVQALRDGGVIPDDASSNRAPAAELREKQLEVLKEIRDAVTNDGGAA